MEVDRKQSLMSENQSEQLQIYFSGRNLADLDLVSVTDSYLRVYLQQTNKPRKKVLQTKIYWNDLNPDYAETLVTQFFFQIRQKIIVQVYHQNTPPELLGVVQTTIGQIFSAKSKGHMKELIDYEGNKRGTLVLRCQKVQKGNNNYSQFNVISDHLQVGSFFLCFGQNDAMFRIYKVKNGEQFLLHQSQYRTGKNNRFNRIKIKQKRLCNNNLEQPILLRFYKQSQIAAPILIGQCRLNLQALIQGNYNYPLIHHGKQKGICLFQDFKRYKKYQFTDYLIAGMQMALVICIDFTGSNGIPKSPTSLHYCGFNSKSQYQQALQQTCKIVMDYDTDKLVPVFGFGAKVRMPNFNTGPKVHHCFPLNGNSQNPNLFQLAGIMQGYRKCMPFLQFSGPTLFAPLLKQAMIQCQDMKKYQKQYMILLILTDGAIHDAQEVKDLLVKCGKLPLSVIIIGIGKSGQWGLMHDLDDDDCQMTDYQGNKTQRDLVQFVQFAEHGNNGVELARQVLQQLPRQVQQYHQLCGLTPEIYQNQVNDIKLQMNHY